jgi:hypothetical protein
LVALFGGFHFESKKGLSFETTLIDSSNSPLLLFSVVALLYQTTKPPNNAHQKTERAHMGAFLIRVSH